MLQIKNLRIHLREDNRLILKDFNFTLNRGDKVGLIGEEGNGKSILIKTIYNVDEVDKYCDVSGEIFKNNEIIGYLPQSVEAFYLDLTTREYMDLHLGKDFFDYNKLYKYLRQFSIDENLISDNIKLSFLSGGEKIKFILLIEMLKEPTILLFDEPSNDLDFDSLLWLERFMGDTELPLIFVSHDTRLLSKVANKIIHLEQTHRRTRAKHTVSKNGYEDYVRKRQDFIQKETNRSQKEYDEFSKKVDRFRRIHDSVQSALRATKSTNPSVGKNLKDKMHTVSSIGKRLEKEEAKLTKKPDYEEAIDIFFEEDIEVAAGKVILDFKLDYLKAGDKLLSNNVELKIIGPEKICILGKNGVGKTTLIKILIKELKDLNLKVGYMPQSYFELENGDISAIEYLSRNYTSEEHTKISTFLGSLNFKREEMYRKIKNLSGGQKAKLFFAKMNLERAEVLVLDEPTRNISPLSQPEIIEALKKYKGAIIAISHDRDFIDQVFEKLYELDRKGLNRIK